jgi:RecB family endonuclease NucS
VQQITLNQETAWYIEKDGSLNLKKLFVAWQKFWRQDGHLAAEGFGYREAGPHLMLMAFLQRILNGGGRIEREYGLGRGALDLHIEWQDQHHAIEVKLRRDTETEQEALEQLARYLDSLGLNEGWLVLFDLRKELSWEAKLTTRELDFDGKKIHVVGC